MPKYGFIRRNGRGNEIIMNEIRYMSYVNHPFTILGKVDVELYPIGEGVEHTKIRHYISLVREFGPGCICCQD